MLPASVIEVAPYFNWSSETGNKSTSADKDVPRTGKPGENQKREASDKQRKWLLPASKGEKYTCQNKLHVKRSGGSEVSSEAEAAGGRIQASISAHRLLSPYLVPTACSTVGEGTQQRHWEHRGDETHPNKQHDCLSKDLREEGQGREQNSMSRLTREEPGT